MASLDSREIVILMADDDPDDRFLAQEALSMARVANRLLFVNDGEDLMDYLHRRGAYTDPARSPRPGLVLMDLNMPKMDGCEALAEIKADPDLRSLPVVMLTTSQAETDIFRSYVLGANSFITKPVTFDGLVEVMHGIVHYWFQIVTTPNQLPSPR